MNEDLIKESDITITYLNNRFWGVEKIIDYLGITRFQLIGACKNGKLPKPILFDVRPGMIRKEIGKPIWDMQNPENIKRFEAWRTLREYLIKNGGS